MCKICWTVAGAASLLSIGLLLKFMVVGATEVSADGDARTTIVVTPAEREHIQAEMRSLLEAVQAIIVANNAGDLSAVAVAARKVGKANLGPKAPEFAAKLPMEFRKLGMDTHTRFDQLALDAEQLENTEHAFQQLGALTGNCVACHRIYRLATSEQE